MFVVHNEQDPARPYHAFIKNEAAKHIEEWKAGSVKGPYEWVGQPAGGDWGEREGPALTKVTDGGAQKWLM